MKRFLPLLAIFILILLVLPRSAKLRYDYRKGSPWKYETLIAPFDFPILKTEDQIMEERRQSDYYVIPYYKFLDDVVSRNLQSAGRLELGSYSFLRQAIVTEIKGIYEKGVVGDEGVVVPEGSIAQAEVIYIQRNKRAASYPVSEVFRLADARNLLLGNVSSAYPAYNVDSVLRAAAVQDLIVPNLAYDRQTTELVKAESSVDISPTAGYVSAGQLIVEKDELVTAEIAQMIHSYEKEYESNMGSSGPGVLFWLGNTIIAFILVTLLYLAISAFNTTIFNNWGKYLYLLMVFSIFTVIALVIPRTDPGLVCVFPFVLCALLLEAFFDNRLVVTVYAISLIPLLLYADSGSALFFMFLAGGCISIVTFHYFNKGWRQFLNAFITFLVMFAIWLGCHFTDLAGGNIIRVGFSLLLSAFLCVAGYPLSYLFERIFNLVSVYRLSELCDTSNPLLHELEQKAPGSFQHSLQVMNMADAVAGAVGANVQLVRAGALYHDIGKMLNPLCFVENESLLAADGVPRYHKDLTPQQSAQDIIRHVSDGDELAQKHRLPTVIRDFILTHHGTSVTGYFYNQYLNAGGDPAGIGDFRYPGRKPVSREQIIVMLCDSIEAASRSLKDYSAESFDAFVERIVAGKQEEGQFDEAEISVKDLGIVKSTIKNYLAQMYHGRIEYPKRKNKLIGFLK